MPLLAWRVWIWGFVFFLLFKMCSGYHCHLTARRTRVWIHWCLFSLSLRGFSQSTLAFSHTPKTCSKVRLGLGFTGDSELSTCANVCMFMSGFSQTFRPALKLLYFPSHALFKSRNLYHIISWAFLFQCKSLLSSSWSDVVVLMWIGDWLE